MTPHPFESEYMPAVNQIDVPPEVMLDFYLAASEQVDEPFDLHIMATVQAFLDGGGARGLEIIDRRNFGQALFFRFRALVQLMDRLPGDLLRLDPDDEPAVVDSAVIAAAAACPLIRTTLPDGAVRASFDLAQLVDLGRRFRLLFQDAAGRA